MRAMTQRALLIFTLVAGCGSSALQSSGGAGAGGGPGGGTGGAAGAGQSSGAAGAGQGGSLVGDAGPPVDAAPDGWIQNCELNGDWACMGGACSNACVIRAPEVGQSCTCDQQRCAMLNECSLNASLVCSGGTWVWVRPAYCPTIM
jgi:hypothetical protein